MRRDQSESTGKERVSKKSSASGFMVILAGIRAYENEDVPQHLPSKSLLSLIELELERLNLLRSGYIQLKLKFWLSQAGFQIAQPLHHLSPPLVLYPVHRRLSSLQERSEKYFTMGDGRPKPPNANQGTVFRHWWSFQLRNSFIHRDLLPPARFTCEPLHT
ncbi:hypothetical protein BJV77DRAFT_217847 [Russula vinacea]|nr:hypothetical protein BJV77DRAFT_217847 [Russula vinacea]